MIFNIADQIKIFILFLVPFLIYQIFGLNEEFHFFNYKIKFIIIYSFFFLLLGLIILSFYLRNKNYIDQNLNFKSILIFLLTTILIISFIKLLTYEYIDKYTLTGVNEHRATHWLTTYQDFGFIKRSLVGSIYNFIFQTKPNFLGIFIISLIILLLKVILILTLIFKVLKNNKNNLIFLSISFFITSPYFIYFYLSDLSRFDQINNLIMLLCIFFILDLKSYTNFILIGFLIFVAILIHESFILLQLPFIFFLLLIEIFRSNNKILDSKKLFYSSIIFFFALFSTYLIIFFGYPGEYNVDYMYNKIGYVSTFDLRKDVLDTFFYIPWNNLSILENIINFFNLDGELPFILLIIDFIVNNLPFLISNIFLLYLLNKNFRSINFKLNKIIYLISLMPLIVSVLITFNDYYRVFATMTLIIFLSNIIYIFKYTNIKYQISNEKFSIFLISGLFYNFFTIGITTITAYSSSSISPFLFLLKKFI